MKENGKRLLFVGSILVVVFVIWTFLIQTVDVQPVGQKGTDIGFATFNCWFHKSTGVHMAVYTITDCLELIPLCICMIFGGIGIAQLVKRRSFFKVDHDIILLGIYYVIVILAFLVFEMIPINYRPILIEGKMEASYPSSTTLLVLSVMPMFIEQINRKLKHVTAKRVISILTIFYSAFMVIGRLISGVHWFTDIVGSVFFSTGIICIKNCYLKMGIRKRISKYRFIKRNIKLFFCNN